MQWQILAKEPAKLAEFYTKLFAWDVDANNALNYRHDRYRLGAAASTAASGQNAAGRP